jgi:hypothetical protein
VTTAVVDEKQLKKAVKTAISEILEERRDMVADLFEEALLDVALGRAIAEGERTPRVSRDKVFAVLGSRP